jgi:hypothetical protein
MERETRRKSRLANLRASGTPLSALEVPTVFKDWLAEHGLATAEAVYGHFYAETPQKAAILSSFGFNRPRLFDRLLKVIPGDKILQLNRLAEESYELGEA